MTKRLIVDLNANERTVYGKTSYLNTASLVSLATNATWSTGRGLSEIPNYNDRCVDRIISGKIRSGTTPTANTIIEIWLIPKLDENVWPDVFTGLEGGFTVTTRAILQNFGALLASVAVDTNTTGRDYPFWGTAMSAFSRAPGGSIFALPHSMQVFVTHNTGVNLNATVGTHVIGQTPVYKSIVPPTSPAIYPVPIG